MNHSEFIREVFTRAGVIVDENNCITYELLGYKYLTQRLILHFHDCKRVIDFELCDGDIKSTSFFTEDHTSESRHQSMVDFDNRFSVDKPDCSDLLYIV